MPWNLRAVEAPVPATAGTGPAPAAHQPGSPVATGRGGAASVTAPRILPVRAGQVAGWEAAALLALLVSGAAPVSTPVRIAVSVLAVLFVAATSVRLAGRHLAGWALTWVGYRLRQHDDRHDTRDPLYALAGDVGVRRHEDRAGHRFGVAEIDEGWTSVVKLTSPGDPDITTLLDILRAACEDTDLPLSSAQLVVWTMPDDQGGAPRRVHWLAVRYHAREAPVAALARGGGQLGTLRTSTRAALGVMGGLAAAGYDSVILTDTELADELRLALGAGPAGSREIVDGWTSWSTGPLKQACFAPLSHGDLPRVLGCHARSATFTATSFTVRRKPNGKVREDLAIRIGTHRESSRAALVSRDLGVPVFPLNGRHATYVRRTLPLALAD
jgi:type VII secretion protein EccE